MTTPVAASGARTLKLGPRRAGAATPAPTARLDVSIVLPCRNEAPTVAACITQAAAWITHRDLSGEVLVVDNASTDRSAALAAAAGARTVAEPRPGYGQALRTGIAAAHGRIVIMADADGTYDLTDLDAFYNPIALTNTADLVIGDRHTRQLPPAAMSRSHRWGNGFLSTLTRTVTHIDVRDFHCGLRSFKPDDLSTMGTWSTGMEYATHMLTHAHATGLRITQTPITLSPPAPGRHSNLRPARDGLRHLGAIAMVIARPQRSATKTRSHPDAAGSLPA